MTQKQSTAQSITKLTGEQVAEFLRINPEFFEDNLDLVSEIQIPHLSGKGTTSLIEHQVKVLRGQNEVLKDQLKTFAVLAGENEELWVRFKDLAVMLLTQGQSETSVLATQIEDWLKTRYNLSGVAVVIDNPSNIARKFKTDNVVKTVIKNMQIRCDSRFSAKLLSEVFGPAAGKVKSCALIPLINQNKQCNGLLALGSENTERFTAEQSTSYLDCLSQLISQVLLPG